MFTGIIEEIGTVRAIKRGAASAVLTIRASEILSDVHLGDRIAVHGVCLTVTGFTPTEFTADVMHETLNRSSLGTLGPGGKVNLERAMAANGRFGGHIVAGHIDGTGTITAIEQDDNALWYTVRCAPAIQRYLIEKGSIAIDGISLTIAALTSDGFRVSIIPHTASKTTLSLRRVGDTVNLENDCVGKYVERLLTHAPAPEAQTPSSVITMEFLAKHGF